MSKFPIEKADAEPSNDFIYLFISLFIYLFSTKMRFFISFFVLLSFSFCCGIRYYTSWQNTFSSYSLIGSGNMWNYSFIFDTYYSLLNGGQSSKVFLAQGYFNSPPGFQYLPLSSTIYGYAFQLSAGFF